MKRLLLVGTLALVVTVCSLELAVRGGGRTTLLATEAVFEPDRRGWCGGAWLETDASGQRRGAAAWLAGTHGRSLVVAGGPFTAGAGLEDSELWPARLESKVRASFDRVVAFAFARDKVAETRRLLPSLGRDDVLAIEVDASDLGADPTPFEIDGATHSLPAIEPGGSAALRWFRLLALRRERARVETEIAALVKRDGFTGRASARCSLRLEALTKAAKARQLDPGQTAFLRAWLAEMHGLERGERRTERLVEWRALFDEIQASQRPTIVVVTGPTPTTLALAQTARDHAFEVLHSPPFELDPDLRVDAPERRPAAIVHAQVADQVWSALTRRTLVAKEEAAPENAHDSGDAIEQQFLSRGGYDEACITLARQQAATELAFTPGPPPVNALHGVGAGGRIDPARPAEIVLQRPVFPRELIVRAKSQDGAPPRLSLRHGLGGAAADPAPLPATASAERGLFEWRFEAPLARSPIDLPALELTCLPREDGAPGSGLELRELRYTLAPSPAEGE